MLFVFAWLLRFNDPNGSFAFLTDDHFFYLVRGWQILFGDLPVRDFVDHGAPLFYYVAAAVQQVFGRGTLSEIAFCVTVLAACGAGVFLLAEGISGSLVLGVAAALLQILLAARFYNYPKILVYVLAIPALWAFADRQSAWRLAAGGLGDRGGVSLSPRSRCVHRRSLRRAAAGLDARAVARACSTRRGLWRAGVVLLRPVSGVHPAERRRGDLLSELPRRGRSRIAVARRWSGRACSTTRTACRPRPRREASSGAPWRRCRTTRWRGCSTASWRCRSWRFAFWSMSPHAFRPSWPNASPKVAVVAALAVMLNVGFLRSPLAARLADPSVPHALLVGVAVVAALRLVWQRRRRAGAVARGIRRSSRRRAAGGRGRASSWSCWSSASPTILPRRLEKSVLDQSMDDAFDRADGDLEARGAGVSHCVRPVRPIRTTC